MEPQNLEAASTYINNVLLARGLLKSGRPIEFANPEDEDGGSAATMGRIINLVNDLVLRRDREAEHRENLATTIRTLRVEESQKTAELEKVKTKASELTRSLALAEAQERALKSNVSSADATIRGLKEQVQRMKTTMQQVRAQCANDIRKRDLEMQKLKSHLAERQRGRREGLAMTTININPAATQSSRSRLAAGGEGINDPGYSLKQETNDFLTELCQTLSDENDTLISLARNTVETLKDLQGLSQAEEDDKYSTGAASVGPSRSVQGSVTALPTSCDELSTQMDHVLEHLRTLLTNPSFVPLEEVEMRDEEIKRLREGWEKMEGRWSQAVTMMDGWHKRIADGGHSVQAEELRRGMDLDLHLDIATALSKDGEREPTIQSPIFEDQQAEEEEEKAAAKITTEDTRRSPSPKKAPRSTRETRSKRLSQALKERSDNIMTGRSPRKVSFTTGLQDSPCVSSGTDETLQVKAHQSEAVTRRSSRRKPESKFLSRPGGSGRSPQPKESRLATAAPVSTSQARLSVPQKLAAVESEARAAEQARKESESRKRGRALKGSSKGHRDRRRSTLTSDELGELMGMPAK
ncbi:NIMA interactive protein [Aspergillus sclerotioniger CBS 115572]|uniref:NIMA interactive protein n=1 Tax=Aspergillus sclerotioniger CBS 115572 TaxID=1450535 RepID=A0A317X8V1_9EURO|nr:NIMA interactive protein [Aspergillus sclerotioniger CBS 115572]PWY94027.1 NIMA interactive protein [Aspergillus sclerotioniger CBS 115572]